MENYNIKILLLIFFCLFSVSCAFAPLSSVKTARPQGKGNIRIDAGLSPTYYINVSRGMTEKIDTGIILEGQFGPVVSPWGKYNFIDGKEDGFSTSAVLGAFLGLNSHRSKGYYLGPVVSYRKKWFETYLFARYNKVYWRAEELGDDDTDNLIIESVSWENTRFGYYQATLGVNFWLTKFVAININAKGFIDEDGDPNYAYGGAIMLDLL